MNQQVNYLADLVAKIKRGDATAAQVDLVRRIGAAACEKAPIEDLVRIGDFFVWLGRDIDTRIAEHN